MTTSIMDETEAQTIPLPGQLLNKIDLSGLPAALLRSGAVEALASQNDDLMARLGVTLRRTALLEEKISQLENQNRELQHRQSVTQDQILVLQEKDRHVIQRYSQHDRELRAKNEQLQLLEAQYAELYVTSKERVRDLQEENSQFQTASQRFRRYRRRMKKAIRGFRERYEQLALRLTREEESNRDLKSRLGDAATHIQGLTNVHRDEQRQLVDNYERELGEIREKASRLTEDNRLLSLKLIEFDQVLETKINLENRLIQEQRQAKEFRESRDRELMELQASLQEYRLAHKTQTLALEQMTNEMSQTNSALESSKGEIRRLQDQVETLQLLWNEGQTQSEKKDTRIQALQNLNQQLSSTIQGQRQEIIAVRHQLEAESANTTERIQELKGHLLVIEKKGLGFEENESFPAPTNQWLSRIDTLIAEIQSGFRRQLPKDQRPSGDSTSVGDSRGIGETAKP